MDRPVSVEKNCIGRAIAVKIRPGKAANRCDPLEWVNLFERAIAVVSEHDGCAAQRCEHDVEIAVHFDVSRPGAPVSDRAYASGKRSGHIRERAARFLAIELK